MSSHLDKCQHYLPQDSLESAQTDTKQCWWPRPQPPAPGTPGPQTPDEGRQEFLLLEESVLLLLLLGGLSRHTADTSPPRLPTTPKPARPQWLQGILTMAPCQVEKSETKASALTGEFGG